MPAQNPLQIPSLPSLRGMAQVMLAAWLGWAGSALAETPEQTQAEALEPSAKANKTRPGCQRLHARLRQGPSPGGHVQKRSVLTDHAVDGFRRDVGFEHQPRPATKARCQPKEHNLRRTLAYSTQWGGKKAPSPATLWEK